MLTQAVTELSATLAASPDIETSWNRIVQQGTPIIESVDTQTVRVTFLWRQPEETEVERVYLDANSLTDHHAEQLSVMQRLGDSPVWFYTAEVSNTWRSSYSIIPVPKSVVDEFDYPGAGKEDSTRRTRWLGVARAPNCRPTQSAFRRCGHKAFRRRDALGAGPVRLGCSSFQEVGTAHLG